MPNVLTYDPREVTAIYGGQIATGFMDDSSIQCAFNKDQWTLVVDKDGNSTRVRNPDRSGRITITLQQSSPFNDSLMALVQADLQNNAGALNWVIKDGSGRTLIATAAAWNVKLPDVTFGTSLTGRTWVYETGILDMVIGGN